MRQFQLAVATRCFHQPLLAAIETAANLHAQGVQFDLRNELSAGVLSESGRRDLLHRISEFGIKIGSSIFPLQHPLYEPTKIDVRIAAIREAMKFAYSIKSKTLCIRVGQIPKEPDSTERKLLLEALNDLARYSSHVGTVLAISQTSDTADTLKTLLDEIKVGPVGIDFDPAQFAMSGHPVADGLKTLHNYIMHVQLRDGIRGVEGGQETAVGRGNVDWIEVLALLGEIDYHGWLTAIRNDGDDRVAETSRGIKFVQKLMLGG